MTIATPLTSEIVGLVPCSGRASHSAALPCSPELLPAGFRQADDGSFRLKVLSQYTLEKMRLAGVCRTFVVLRKGGWDIPEYYGHDPIADMDLAYLVTHGSPGSLFALEHASSFINGARVAFGSPDVLFGPAEAYALAFERMTATGAAAVLGLFRPREGDLRNVVEVDALGRVSRVCMKVAEGRAEWRWVFAVWTPVFTDFLRAYVTGGAAGRERVLKRRQSEPQIGHVISAAIEAGHDVRSVMFPHDDYLDINTPDGLLQTLDASDL